MKMNSLGELNNYFYGDTNPFSVLEFAIFWVSCTEEERDYYRWVDLDTGLLQKE